MENKQQQNTEFKTKFKEFTTSIYVKAGMVLFLILLLLIPKSMIESITDERKESRDQAIYEVSSKWGLQQTITAAVITVPYTEFKEEFKKGKMDTIEYKKLAHFLPTELNIDGEIIPKERYRGIYKVPLYQGQFKIHGNFDNIDFSKWNIQDSCVHWDEATIAFGISDLRGIQENINLNWNGQNQKFKPINKYDNGIDNALSSSVKVKRGSNTFELNLNVNGSSSLLIAPLGQQTNVKIKSDWKDPSFLGDFLPDNKTINDSGFVANWKVNELNRPISQEWLSSEKNVNLNSSNFGVTMFIPIDHYQKSMRSVKYSILTIVLTFALFLFIEFIKLRNMHIVQYLLVGLSLVLFYSLLVSLSEHMNFNISYWIAASAIVLLITFYTAPVLKSLKLSAILFLTVTCLYSFVFFLLQLESYALLFGNIGLFVILSIIMMATRKFKFQ